MDTVTMNTDTLMNKNNPFWKFIVDASPDGNGYSPIPTNNFGTLINKAQPVTMNTDTLMDKNNPFWKFIVDASPDGGGLTNIPVVNIGVIQGGNNNITTEKPFVFTPGSVGTYLFNPPVTLTPTQVLNKATTTDPSLPKENKGNILFNPIVIISGIALLLFIS